MFALWLILSSGRLHDACFRLEKVDAAVVAALRRRVRPFDSTPAGSACVSLFDSAQEGDWFGLLV